MATALRRTRQCVAFCYAMANVGLLLDMAPLVGPDGLWPAEHFHKRRWEDFPHWCSVLAHFPSILHLTGSSMSAMRSVATLGLAASLHGLMAAYPPTFVAMFVCFGSFTVADGLVLWFPWDGMLLEAGLLCALCFERGPQPRAVQFGFRWLAFRVLFGFGKHKFYGSSFAEAYTYIQSFLIIQPNPSAVAWLVSHRWTATWPFAAMYALLFVCELIAPIVLIMLPDCALRRFCARLIVILMGCIGVGGRFAWFNLLTVAVVWPSAAPLDPAEKSPTLERNARELAACSRPRACRLRAVLVSLWVVGSLPFLIPSQWCSPGFLYWGEHVSSGIESSWALSVLRILSAWRVVHAYGVFPPSLPSVSGRSVLRWELSFDGGNSWHKVRYRHMDVWNDERPPWPSPLLWHFPRLEYLTFYDGAHMLFTPSTDFSPSPYLRSPFTHRHRFARDLLANGPASRQLIMPDAPQRLQQGAFDEAPQFGMPRDEGSFQRGRLVRATVARIFPAAQIGGDNAKLHCPPQPHSIIPDTRGTDTPTFADATWSCDLHVSTHLLPTSLIELERRLNETRRSLPAAGQTDHVDGLLRPWEFGPNAAGYTHLHLSLKGKHGPPSDTVEQEAGLRGVNRPAAARSHFSMCEHGGNPWLYSHLLEARRFFWTSSTA